MDTLRKIFSTEPIIILNAVKAIIGLLVAFGLLITGAQTAAIVAAVAAVLVVGSALFMDRSQVRPKNHSLPARRGRTNLTDQADSWR